LQMTTSCPLLSKTPLGAKCCALGKRIFGDFIPLYRRGIRAQGRFWPKRLGFDWAQAVVMGGTCKKVDLGHFPLVNDCLSLSLSTAGGLRCFRTEKDRHYMNLNYLYTSC
jgi:hypothetical protein